jgi:hypothetical protein
MGYPSLISLAQRRVIPLWHTSNGVKGRLFFSMPNS